MADTRDDIPETLKPDNLDLKCFIRDSHMKHRAMFDNVQLPKSELISFDGNPLKYWTFICAFKHIVDYKVVEDSAKFLLLFQYCTGKARNVIECCTVMEPTAGYSKA